MGKWNEASGVVFYCFDCACRVRGTIGGGLFLLFRRCPCRAGGPSGVHFPVSTVPCRAGDRNIQTGNKILLSMILNMIPNGNSTLPKITGRWNWALQAAQIIGRRLQLGTASCPRHSRLLAPETRRRLRVGWWRHGTRPIGSRTAARVGSAKWSDESCSST